MESESEWSRSRLLVVNSSTPICSVYCHYLVSPAECYGSIEIKVLSTEYSTEFSTDITLLRREVLKETSFCGQNAKKPG